MSEVYKFENFTATECNEVFQVISSVRMKFQSNVSETVSDISSTDRGRGNLRNVGLEIHINMADRPRKFHNNAQRFNPTFYLHGSTFKYEDSYIL
jgi:hypothetical protein